MTLFTKQYQRKTEKMALGILWLASLFIFQIVNGEILYSLNSDQQSWTVVNGNSSINVAAKVPGGIYTDLQAAGILDSNLFYRFNDIDYRWVGYENWTYQTTFELPEEVANKTRVNLVFHGLDTIGSIYLNDEYVGSVNNMFVRYIYNVSQLVREGSNTLTVKFISPVSAAKELADKQSQDYSVPPDCPQEAQHGECHVNFLRKMQSSFSWDWGPAFPSVGIWKSVEIEAFDTAIVREVVGTPRLENDTWYFESVVYFEAAKEDLFEYATTIELDAPRTNEKIAKVQIFELQKDLTKEYGFTSNFTFEIPDVIIRRWWPNGYGDQPLYTLIGIFESFENGSETSSKSVKIGARKVELVQEPVTENGNGLSFYFKINDVPIFAKGANWIPGHVLPELGYSEVDIRRELLSAKEASMNMLRVWGGGVYESETFYQIADELGIMIWQDMMFAVALYPTDEEFLKSVSIEIEQQVRRLQNHASVVIWAGNNENEAALTGNWFGYDQSNAEQFYQDYIKLYVDTIKPAIDANDHSRWYAPSSPSNGIETVNEGYISQNPSDVLYGDIHYYNYQNDPWDMSTFPTTRFTSEYGYEAMPSFRSIAKVSLPEDWKISSQFTQQRQHHPNGYNEMTNLMNFHLPLPEDDGSEEYYRTFIYYSQISQAMATKTESEKYRQDRHTYKNENDEGFTMGALYWQLNDVWQAPTWSSIELGGRWKMLHYYAVNFFAPVIVSPRRDGDEVFVYVISDLLTELPECHLAMDTYSWHEAYPVNVTGPTIVVPPLSSNIYMSFKLTSWMEGYNCTLTTCFLHYRLQCGGVYAENFLFPVSFKDVTNFEPATVNAAVHQNEETGEIYVDLTTDEIAPFVWLETDVEGQFSDNGFTLIDIEKRLQFSNRGQEVDVNKLRDTLTIQTLLKPLG